MSWTKRAMEITPDGRLVWRKELGIKKKIKKKSARRKEGKEEIEMKLTFDDGRCTDEKQEYERCVNLVVSDIHKLLEAKGFDWKFYVESYVESDNEVAKMLRTIAEGIQSMELTNYGMRLHQASEEK